MTRTLTFKTVAADSVLVVPGPGPQFIALPSTLQRVSAEPEGAIVKWLLDRPQVRRLVYEELKLTADFRCWHSVGKPIVEDECKKPGDIDILLCRKDQPGMAVGIQCKRIKAIAQVGFADKVNRLCDVGDGVEQANRQREMGFHENYFMILVAVDGTQRSECNVLFRGVAPETFQNVYDLDFQDALHKDIGVMFMEVVQPSSKSLDAMSVVGVCVDRPAVPLEQTASLTGRIRKFLKVVDPSE